MLYQCGAGRSPERQDILCNMGGVFLRSQDVLFCEIIIGYFYHKSIMLGWNPSGARRPSQGFRGRNGCEIFHHYGQIERRSGTNSLSVDPTAASTQQTIKMNATDRELNDLIDIKLW